MRIERCIQISHYQCVSNGWEEKWEYEQSWCVISAYIYKMCRNCEPSVKEQEQKLDYIWKSNYTCRSHADLVMYPVACSHERPCQTIIYMCVLLDLHWTWGCLLILLMSSVFRSAAWPLAVAVKKPLREWGAWLPVPCLLINDLLLELATNLERDGGGGWGWRWGMVEQKEGWREEAMPNFENLAQFIFTFCALLAIFLEFLSFLFIFLAFLSSFGCYCYVVLL